MSINSRETLENLVKEQLLTIVNNYDTKNDYNFIITENLNKHEDDLIGNEVFIVFTFTQGTMYYKQTLQPATINIVCNQNYAVEISQIMNSYVETYNLKKSMKDGLYILQSYTTPSIITKFDDFDKDYSIVGSFTASFLINPGVTPIETITINDEEIPFSNARIFYSNGMDAKIFPSLTNAYTESIAQYGSVIISFTSFLDLSKEIMSDCLDMTDELSEISQDKHFTCSVKFSNNKTIDYSMKISTFELSQEQSGLPVVQVQLTR